MNFAKLVERSCCGKNPRLSGKPTGAEIRRCVSDNLAEKTLLSEEKTRKAFSAVIFFLAIALVMYFALSVSCCHLYILYLLGNRSGGDFENVAITCSREILRFVTQKMSLSGYNATELLFI